MAQLGVMAEATGLGGAVGRRGHGRASDGSGAMEKYSGLLSHASSSKGKHKWGVWLRQEGNELVKRKPVVGPRGSAGWEGEGSRQTVVSVGAAS